jgi:thymidine kinase
MTTGRVEVIAGCMFAGKTAELIDRLRRGAEAGLRVRAFKHRLDARYRAIELATHDGRAYPALAVSDVAAIAEAARELDVLGVDEAQFFGPPIVELCAELRTAGKRVIVVGIDFNIRGRPFRPFPELKAMADEVCIMHHPCDGCGAPAVYSQRIAPIVDGNMVGGRAEYSPRCEACFVPWEGEIPVG